MPLHHQIPPTHVHRLPGIPPPSAATNGSATPPSRMPVHHHHGIHLPPPTVMLSMPPPSVTMQQGGVVTTQAQPIHTMQQNMHIQPYIHHHSPVNRNVNGNGEVHLQQHHYNKRQQQQQHNTTKNNIKNFNSSKPMVGKKPLGKHPPDKQQAAKLPIPLLGSKAAKGQPHQGQHHAKPLMTSTLPPPSSQQSQKTTQPMIEPKKTNFEAMTLPNEVEDHSNPSKVKTPMCLINELARYNKIQQQYRLTDESGPAHKKTFTVCLKLGDCEEYIASGPSIKKAQHAAAAIAMEKTKLKHPPPKSRLVKNTNVTPTVELNALAMKRGEPTVYTFTDTIRPQGQMPASGTTASINFRGMYNQRYHQQGQKGNAGSSGTTTSTNVPMFRVKLSVGPLEVTGEGSTAQAAKHAAATNALLKIKESPLPHRTSQSGSGSISIKSNLNPASVPFVPSSAKSPAKAASASVASSGTSVTASLSSSTTVTSMTSSSMASSSSAVSPATSSKAESEADSTTSKDTNFSELKSPISLVHENALKRNLTVKFEVVRETGPPHMRTFLTRCIVGEFVTEGEGNGKKSSKTEAALLMIEKLKDLPPVASCQKVPKKKSTSAAAAAAAKKKSKNLIKLEQKANPDYGQSINPISRLIQIQQAKKQKEPVYTLIAERGMPRRREFVMEVSAAGANAQGSGPNKKLAKRSAAESLLQIMGYSRPSLQPAKPALKNTNSNGSTASSSTSSTMSTSSITNGELKTTHSAHSPASKDKTKKLTFVDQVKAGENCRKSNGNNEKNNVVPGLLYLDPNTKKDDALRLLQAENGVLTNGFSQAESDGKAEDDEDDAKILEPKEELQYLSEVLGFVVTFTDFPQKSSASKTKSSSSQHSSPPEFITLVKLSTKPPKVCHGQGSTRDASQTDAARRALVLLADSGELNDEDNNQSSPDNLFNGNGNNDSIPIVSATASAATPSENDNSCA